MELKLIRALNQNEIIYTLYVKGPDKSTFLCKKKKGEIKGYIKNKKLMFNILQQPEIEVNNIKESCTYKSAAFEVKNDAGSIYFISERRDVYNGIYYFKLEYQNSMYELYEVGLGSEGTYLCIWNSGILKGIVSRVREGQFNTYNLYSIDSLCEEVLVLSNIYWDYIRFLPDKEEPVLQTINTCQTVIRKKFIPSFIPYITGTLNEAHYEEEA